jgi:3-oxoacyl-[acyl-carrier-protein] synthase II
MNRRVVITGLGVVSSLSCQVEDLFRRLVAGESGIHHIKLFDTARFKVKIGGDVWDWDPPETYLDRRELRRIDRFSQFALVAATDAIRDSGLDFGKEDATKCGVILGSGIGGLNEDRAISAGPPANHLP